MGDDGEVVEPFFDEETDYSVGVEDEICSLGVFISDHARCPNESVPRCVLR